MRQSNVQKVAAFFRQHPGEWIDGRTLEGIGGVYAWRTRVSNCRRQLEMQIDNRQREMARPDGTVYTISEYRYLPRATGEAA